MKISTLLGSTSVAAFAALVPAAFLPGVTSAQTRAAGGVDYSNEDAWLCRPGRDDACTVDLETTIVQADGSLSREAWSRNASPPIDCFYVYPTISTDATPNSDMIPNEAELRVVAQQFARFGSVCRTFAPSYRQVTLAGLRGLMAGGGIPDLATGTAYEDVLAAFRQYVDSDNDGRGFVLIGHSQGSFILTRLVREEIDGQSIQDRMVSALLLGAEVTLARDQDSGGSFNSIPVCRSARQTGCVVAYSAFRSTAPPPQSTLFGNAPDADHAVACTNPAALSGGSGQLHPYLSADGMTIVGGRPAPPGSKAGRRSRRPS